MRYCPRGTHTLFIYSTYIIPFLLSRLGDEEEDRLNYVVNCIVGFITNYYANYYPRAQATQYVYIRYTLQLSIWYSTYLCYSWHVYLSNQLVDELVTLFEHEIPDTHRIILGQCIEHFAKAHLKGLSSTAKVYLFFLPIPVYFFHAYFFFLSSWTMCGCIISCLCKGPMPITRATFVP